jgi:chemotaxis protein CheD
MTVAYTTAPRPPEPPPPDAIVYVHPGRTLAGSRGESFTTVVGSGIAVCIWDPVRGLGGMAHFLLPDSGNAPGATRFGNVAMKGLVESIGKLGGDVRRLRARLFGGNAPPIAEGGPHLGDRNLHAALEFLAAHTILVVQRDVGGKSARKILFNSRTGAAEVVHIGG